MRRLSRWVLLLSVCVAVVAACGGSSQAKLGNQKRKPMAISRIVFTRTSTDGSAVTLYTANTDGSHLQEVPLTYRPETFSFPAWSPGRTRLLISHTFRLTSSGSCCRPFRPAIVNRNGSGFTQLVMRYAPADMDCPVWSRNARRIFCNFGGAHPGVFSVRAADGGNPVRLTKFGAGIQEAVDLPTSISPNGKRFLFIRFRPGKGANRERDKMTALFVENTNGTGLRQITPYGLTAAHEDEWAAWSPNGREILSVAAGRAGHPGRITCFQALGACLATRSHLFVIHPDGSGLHTIALQVPTSDRDYRVLQPSWSPDGSRIVFCLWPNGGNEDIYTAKADGSNVIQITSTPNFEYAPRWG